MTGGRLLDVLIKRILLGKFWSLGQRAPYGRWSHTEVPLYYYELIVLFWFVFMK